MIAHLLLVLALVGIVAGIWFTEKGHWNRHCWYRFHTRSPESHPWYPECKRCGHSWRDIPEWGA